MAMAKEALEQLRIDAGEKFRIADHSARWLPPAAKDLSKSERKAIAEQMLATSKEELAAAQEVLYADGRHSVLILFQAMDAAGKDGAIKHVMSGINPQGCEVTSFKSPSAEELDHDFLWRCMKRLPERGRIGIFNRSYYEEVLVVRVHEAILKSQKLPANLITDSIWDERLKDISNFEKYLNNNGIMVVKIFLNVSKKEQKKRFLERIDKPDKNWKFANADVEERKYWKQYMSAYEDVIKSTATERSPWYVIPADNKPYARIVVSSAILHALDSMKLAYPVIDEEQLIELQRLKQELLSEK